MAKNGKIIKAGIGYTVGNYLLKGVAFITTPIFARMMTTADYGKYSVFVSYESILFVILGLAIHSSYKNAYYKFRDEENPENEKGYYKYVSMTMVFLFGCFAAWLLISWILNKPISEALSIDSSSVYILVAASFTAAVANCFSADKGIHYQYKQIISISLIATLTSVGLSILLMKTAFADRMYLGRIIGGFLPGFFIYLTIAITYICKASFRGMKKALGWGIMYSLPIVPHGISQIILGQFDRIMISRIIGESEAGIYSFAYTIYSMITVASSSVDGIWSPWFYSKRKQEDYETIKTGSTLYSIVMLLAATGVIALCPEFIRILGGEKYREAIYCVIPVVCGGFFACLYNVPCLVEYYHEKTKLIAASTASAALMNIVLNAIFIPVYGYVAAAYTTLATYILYFLVHYIVAAKIEKKDLFPGKWFLVCTIILVFSAVITMMTLELLLVRIFLFLLIASGMIFYEEKKYAWGRNWLKSRKGKGEENRATDDAVREEIKDNEA